MARKAGQLISLGSRIRPFAFRLGAIPEKGNPERNSREGCAKSSELDGDGIALLTHLEVRAMPLRGRLLVVSACESAVKPAASGGLGLGRLSSPLT